MSTDTRKTSLSPALLNAVFLYGAHLSCVKTLTMHEPTLLARAVEAVSSDLASQNQYPLTHTIQAEVIIANYFFCVGRLLEGKYHASAAVALVLSERLHKIRASSPSDRHPPSDPPLDRIEEGERINAFWTVFALDKEWAVVSGTLSQLDGQDAPVAVDTPWPLDIEEYEDVSSDSADALYAYIEKPGLPPDTRGSRTVHNFLHGVPSASVGGTSFLALRAKAAALLERATRLATSVPECRCRHLRTDVI